MGHNDRGHRRERHDIELDNVIGAVAGQDFITLSPRSHAVETDFALALVVHPAIMLGNLNGANLLVDFVAAVLAFINAVAVDFLRVGYAGIGRKRLDLVFVKALLDEFGLALDDLMKAIIRRLDGPGGPFDAEFFGWDAENLGLAYGLFLTDLDIVYRL